MVQGDLACYLTLEVAGGKERTLMAEFELCGQAQRYRHKRVRLGYRPGSVNDCQSAEPCGKTRRVNLVHALEILP